MTPNSWLKSVSETIAHTVGPDANPESFGVAVIRKKVFGNRLDDAEHAKAVFKAHNAEVIATIPPGRLLVYEVKEGWQPLCDFLGVSVPAEPFPLTNTTDGFRQNVLSRMSEAKPGG